MHESVKSASESACGASGLIIEYEVLGSIFAFAYEAYACVFNHAAAVYGAPYTSVEVKQAVAVTPWLTYVAECYAV